MKKNIEWLKNEVNELPLSFLGFSVLKQREEFGVKKDDVLELINQLDEPEVLSQELPAIPKFVADWIDVAKSRHHTLLQAVDEYAPAHIKNWVWKQYNSDLFGKAWLAYPNIEVEEEQKYLLKHNGKYLKSVKVKTHHGREKIEELNIHLGYTAKEYAQIFTKEQKEHIEKHINIEVEELEE